MTAMSKAEAVIENVVLPWMALVVVVVFAGAIIGLEGMAFYAIRSSTEVVHGATCQVVSITNTGRVNVTCNGRQDHFGDVAIALSETRRPQPLTCNLYQAKGRAECKLPGAPHH